MAAVSQTERVQASGAPREALQNVSIVVESKIERRTFAGCAGIAAACPDGLDGVA